MNNKEPRGVQPPNPTDEISGDNPVLPVKIDRFTRLPEQ